MRNCFKDSKLLEVDGTAAAVPAVKEGRADTFMFDDAFLIGVATQDPSLKLTNDKFLNVPWGIGIRKGDTAMNKWVNAAMKYMKERNEFAHDPAGERARRSTGPRSSTTCRARASATVQPTRSARISRRDCSVRREARLTRERPPVGRGRSLAFVMSLLAQLRLGLRSGTTAAARSRASGGRSRSPRSGSSARDGDRASCSARSARTASRSSASSPASTSRSSATRRSSCRSSSSSTGCRDSRSARTSSFGRSFTHRAGSQ